MSIHTNSKLFINSFKDQRKAILFLYLLHCGPDNAYSISKVFTDGIDKNIWNVKKTKTLADPGRVGELLREMSENKLIYIKEDDMLKTERRQVWYDINYSVLLDEKRFFNTTDQNYKYLSELVENWANHYQDEEKQDAVIEKVRGKLTGKNLRDIDECKGFIDDFRRLIKDMRDVISDDKLNILKKINELNKYDYVTVLIYTQEMFKIILNTVKGDSNYAKIAVNKYNFPIDLKKLEPLKKENRTSKKNGMPWIKRNYIHDTVNDKVILSIEYKINDTLHLERNLDYVFECEF